LASVSPARRVAIDRRRDSAAWVGTVRVVS